MEALSQKTRTSASYLRDSTLEGILEWLRKKELRYNLNESDGWIPITLSWEEYSTQSFCAARTEF
jgi:hypothetical protein